MTIDFIKIHIEQLETRSGNHPKSYGGNNNILLMQTMTIPESDADWLK